MTEALISWASPRLAHLLPLDDQSLSEILQYTASLSKSEGAEHLKNLLGDSPQALEFISSFNARRQDVVPPQPASQIEARSGPGGGSRGDGDGGPSTRKRGEKKAKAPLHSAGPVRRPDDYGNIAGGYRKSTAIDDEYAAPSARPSTLGVTLSNALSFSQHPEAVQAPKAAKGSKPASPLHSRDISPSPQKMPPSASGPLISDLPNIKSKPSKKPTHSGASTPRKSTTTTTTSSINDLTSAIAALELSTNPSLSNERRKCGCHGTIHPLFEPAPNCLSCGQIICALEGLQPCSFCDTPILSPQQVQNMIRSLREERGSEKMTLHNAAMSHSGKGSPALGGTPESSGDELSSAAAKARAHRDKLLAFQRDNAQRTRVYDEAADYDMTTTPGATQWMSPAQRALALKKQQKYLRELEEERRPEWEKKKTVLSMSVKNGKLVRSYERVQEEKAAEKELDHEEVVDDAQVESDHASDRKGAFGKNPLLAGGGLVRPIWKPANDGNGKQKEERERKQTWRKVQDDTDDNEQWILDGGIYGPGDEERHESG